LPDQLAGAADAREPDWRAVALSEMLASLEVPLIVSQLA
jgi:hypothetical protein